MLVRIENGRFNRRYFERHYNIPCNMPKEVLELLKESLEIVEDRIMSNQDKIEEALTFINKYKFLTCFPEVNKKQTRLDKLRETKVELLSLKTLIEKSLTFEILNVHFLLPLSNFYILKVK